MVNVRKCLELFKYVYVSSDDLKILTEAQSVGAIPILRGESLCGDTPNIPVYKHALTFMANPKYLVAVQANSPTIKPEIIKKVAKKLRWNKEVMTCDENKKIYGSVWGLKVSKLKNYGDPYGPKPSLLIFDPSTDIHTEEDYKKALYE